MRAFSGYPLALDRANVAVFEPVVTTALRLVFAMREGLAADVHEWRVIEDDEAG